MGQTTGANHRMAVCRQTTGWLCAKLSFAILRATNLCLRGSRTKWRSGVGIDDGAGLRAELPKSD